MTKEVIWTSVIFFAWASARNKGKRSCTTMIDIALRKESMEETATEQITSKKAVWPMGE